MKKSSLITGGLYTLLGVVCLMIAGLTETKLDGILWGFTGAGIGLGIMLMGQYFYWNSLKNKERYAERLENKRIEVHDELNTKIRDKAGRYTFILGLLVTCIAIMIFSILGALGIVADTRIILLYLGGYLFFQELAGIFIFKRLMKKY